MTPANFRADYACTGNTLIWLAGIRGKTLIWLACIRGITCSLATNKFYRECQPIKWECYLCKRSQRGEENWFLSPWKLIFITVENGFLPPWKLIFTAVENWFLLPWKFIFTTVDFDFYYHGKLLLTAWEFFFLSRHPYLHLNVLASQDEHKLQA